MGNNGLVALQERIIQASASDDEMPKSILLFQVASGSWGIDFSQVDSISSCGQIAPVWSRVGIPAAVIGLSAASGRILTVVDGGLAFGANPVQMNLKSRLITFGDGLLKGIALLVDRVVDPVNSSAIQGSGHGTFTLVDQAAIAEKLNLGTVK